MVLVGWSGAPAATKATCCCGGATAALGPAATQDLAALGLAAPDDFAFLTKFPPQRTLSVCPPFILASGIGSGIEGRVWVALNTRSTDIELAITVVRHRCCASTKHIVVVRVNEKHVINRSTILADRTIDAPMFVFAKKVGSGIEGRVWVARRTPK